jgi:glutamate/tyrosine decarboxylase-like PLP-dependent enzyme
MVDDMLDYQETVRERPPWRPVPADVRARLDESVPLEGAPLAEIYELFRRDVLPYPTGNIHPRFWGWVMGTGTPAGMLAEMLAAGMNAHVAGFDQAASLVEKQVLKWLKSLMGFPEAASGILVSGATAANLNGLLAARAAKAGWDIRENGLHAGPPLTIYGSSETHSWASKACDTMGMGRAAFRQVAADIDYRLDLAACRAMILADRRAGLRPIAIIGNVGTVNTGAVDDLDGIRALADELDLWFHIDGAFGSLAAWSDSRDLVAGQELADSIAFDLHKWGYMPYEVAVVLTRDADAQLAAFGAAHAGSAAYLLSLEQGVSADTTYFADRGLQLTRGFRALKVWMSMKEQGVARIGAAIQANIDQARHLAGRIEGEPRLELLAPVSLNTVCFRYAGSVPDERLDALNQEILTELQVRGIAVPSQTVLGGRFAIRVCITNHRSELSDFDALVEAVLALGEEILDRGTGRVAVSGAPGDRQWASPAGNASRSDPKSSLEAEGES